jgi:hypothetical protein
MQSDDHRCTVLPICHLDKGRLYEELGRHPFLAERFGTVITAQTYKDSLPRLRALFHWPGPSGRSPIGHRSEGCPATTTCNPKRLHMQRTISMQARATEKSTGPGVPTSCKDCVNSDNLYEQFDKGSTRERGAHREDASDDNHSLRASPGFASKLQNDLLFKGPVQRAQSTPISLSRPTQQD